MPNPKQVKLKQVKPPAMFRKPPARCPTRSKFTRGEPSTTDPVSTADGRCALNRPCGFWYGFGNTWHKFLATVNVGWTIETIDSYTNLYSVQLRPGVLESVLAKPRKYVPEKPKKYVLEKPRASRSARQKILVVRGAAGAREFSRRFVRPDQTRSGDLLEIEAERTAAVRSYFRTYDRGWNDDAAVTKVAPYYDWSKLMAEYAGVEFRGMLAAVRSIARAAKMDARAITRTWAGKWTPSRPGYNQHISDDLLWLFALNVDSGVVWDPPAVFLPGPRGVRLVAHRNSGIGRWKTVKPLKPSQVAKATATN